LVGDRERRQPSAHATRPQRRESARHNRVVLGFEADHDRDGEAASDYLLNTMGFVGFGIGLAGFAFALLVQFRTRRYNVFAYWAAVMMVAVFGTMAADVVHHHLGVSLGMSTLFGALAVAATFWAWHRSETHCRYTASPLDAAKCSIG